MTAESQNSLTRKVIHCQATATREDVLHKDYDCKGTVVKKKELWLSVSRGLVQRLIGGKPPVVK
jgi:hypothetical protein